MPHRRIVLCTTVRAVSNAFIVSILHPDNIIIEALSFLYTNVMYYSHYANTRS